MNNLRVTIDDPWILETAERWFKLKYRFVTKSEKSESWSLTPSRKKRKGHFHQKSFSPRLLDSGNALNNLFVRLCSSWSFALTLDKHKWKNRDTQGRC